MKKLLSVVLVLFLSILSISAQTYIQAGLNMANITSTNNGLTQDNSWLPSFNVGLMSRLNLNKVFDLESGLIITGKGSKANTYYGNGTDYEKTKFNPIYAEVPLNVVLKFPLSKKSKANIFFHAGPYLAIGIGGNSTVNTKIAGVESNSSSSIKFSNNDPFSSQQDNASYNKLKRYDFGANIGGGIDFGGLILRANYGFGLSKIHSTENNNTANEKNKYRTFSFSIGIPLDL